jgi:hypothetical protein
MTLAIPGIFLGNTACIKSTLKSIRIKGIWITLNELLFCHQILLKFNISRPLNAENISFSSKEHTKMLHIITSINQKYIHNQFINNFHINKIQSLPHVQASFLLHKNRILQSIFLKELESHICNKIEPIIYDTRPVNNIF